MVPGCMQVEDFIENIEQDAPKWLALDWDNSGIQVAAEKKSINTVGVALDPLPDVIKQATALDCDFLLCHHPLSISPKLPDKNDSFRYALKLLLQADIHLYSAHTSLDTNPKKAVSWLGRELKLEKTRVIMPTFKRSSECIYFHPALNISSQNLPLFFQLLQVTEDQGKVSRVVLPKDCADSFLTHLEELVGPILFSRKLSPEHEQVYGLGLMGSLPEKVSFSHFMELLEQSLGIRSVTYAGHSPGFVQNIAYCPGSGGDLAAQAFNLGADVFITGDLKYHQAQDVQNQGLVLDVGHFILEEKMMQDWCRTLSQNISHLDFHFIQGRTPFNTTDVHTLKTYSGEDQVE